MTNKIKKLFTEIDGKITNIELERAFSLAISTLTEIDRRELDRDFYFRALFQLSGFFVDIGHLTKNENTRKNASKIGLDLLSENEKEFIELEGEFNFYYFFANAHSNLTVISNPFEYSFYSIGETFDLASLYWKALKASEFHSLENAVNLANTLKRQFRLVEALKYYDEVITCAPHITQAWVNRSDALRLLNLVSDRYSLVMLEEMKNGYLNASEIVNEPNPYQKFWLKKAVEVQNKIDSIAISEGIEISESDHSETEEEFASLSEYRKFCLDNYLTLCEHALYCRCSGAIRDDLSIPHSGGVIGDYIVPMEKLLNRIKSEFGLARKLFYDATLNMEDQQNFFELGYSDIDSEELGMNAEMLRTAFRLCFGVLDRVALGICELFDIYFNKKYDVSFLNMWRIKDNPERIVQLSKFNNPSLLALFCIASDLNENKSGEWAFFKEYRNALEHEFVVLYNKDNAELKQEYGTFRFKKKITYIEKSDFESNLLLLLQLTRSAIYSFVFAVREYSSSKKTNSDNTTKNIMRKKDSLS